MNKKRLLTAIGGSQKTWLYLDGVDDLIYDGNDATIQNLADNAFTAEGWFNSKNITAGGLSAILSKTLSDNGWYIRFCNTNQIQAAVICATTTAYVSPVTTIYNDSKWHHIAMTWDDAGDRKVRLFVDGVIVGTSGAGVGAVVDDSTRNLQIGGFATTHIYHGEVGWVRISNSVRYTTTFTPPSRFAYPSNDANTVRLYRINEGGGTNIKDYSANESNATLTGGTWVKKKVDIPYILLGLDDGFASTYEIAYPYLKAKGVKATLYQPVNTMDVEGYCTTAQLQEMNTDGTILVCNHTVNQYNLTLLTLAQQTAEFVDCKAALDAIGCTKGSRHVAYPSGEYNATTLQAMSDAGMLTGRTTTGGAFQLPMTTPFEVGCGLAIGRDTGISWANTQVLNAVNKKQIIVIYMHDIAETPTNEMQMSTVNFQSFIDYIVTLNAEMLTISELYNKLGS